MGRQKVERERGVTIAYPGRYIPQLLQGVSVPISTHLCPCLRASTGSRQQICLAYRLCQLRSWELCCTGRLIFELGGLMTGPWLCKVVRQARLSPMSLGRLEGRE